MLYYAGEQKGSFFYVVIFLAPDAGSHKSNDRVNTGKIAYFVEENKMRTRITLACTECKQRNYNTTKEKKNHPDRMETMKYCKFCKKHTMHKETK